MKKLTNITKNTKDNLKKQEIKTRKDGREKDKVTKMEKENKELKAENKKLKKEYNE